MDYKHEESRDDHPNESARREPDANRNDREPQKKLQRLPTISEILQLLDEIE